MSDDPADRFLGYIRADIADAAVAAAYKKAARRVVSFPGGTIMHSPPQMLTDAHDDILTLTPADALTALEQVKAEAYRQGWNDALEEVIEEDFEGPDHCPVQMTYVEARDAIAYHRRAILAAAEGDD